MRKHCHSTANFVLRVLCLLVAGASLITLAWQFGVQLQSRRAVDAMQKLYDPSASAEEEVDVSEIQPRENFAGLLDANPDTVGWLVAGESINFAIVQSDNAYYLNHNFFGESSVEGTAFVDEGNTILPLDEHILIHGHNMKNGSVFGDLDYYRELDYLKQYPLITFNTLYEDMQFVPIAVLDMSAEPGEARYFDLQQFNFETDDEFDNFVAELQSRSYFDIPVDVQRGDQLLSLITCSYYDENGRFVMLLRALRPGELTIDMEALIQQAVKKD